MVGLSTLKLRTYYGYIKGDFSNSWMRTAQRSHILPFAI